LSQQLQHTYLRVLHPLLTKTQLRDLPYKRAQIVVALESLMENSEIRDIDPTTKRLVERCLRGEWCAQYRKPKAVRDTLRRDAEVGREGSPDADSVTSTAQAAPVPSTSRSSQLARQGSARTKTLKTSRSVENLKGKSKPPRPPRTNMTVLRRPSGISMSSLSGVAGVAGTISPISKRRDLSRSGEIQCPFAAQQAERYHQPRNTDSLRPHPPARSDPLDTSIDLHTNITLPIIQLILPYLQLDIKYYGPGL
jgi:hypothetical protein